MKKIYFLKDFKLGGFGRTYDVTGGNPNYSVELDFEEHCPDLKLKEGYNEYTFLTADCDGKWIAKPTMLESLIRDGFLAIEKPAAEGIVEAITGKRGPKPKEKSQEEEEVK